MTEKENQDDLRRLINDGYSAPKPRSHFVQSLGNVLSHELQSLAKSTEKGTRVSKRRKQPRMSWLRPFLSTTRRKVAFTCCAILVLVAAAWGAEKAYKKIANLFVGESVVVDVIPAEKVTTPNRTTVEVSSKTGVFTVTESVLGSMMSVSVGYGPEDPTFGDEKTRQQFEEMKGLVAQRKYNFVKNLILPSGEKQYVYSFTLANGEQFVWNFVCPLEEVASWDEYRQKKAERLAKSKGQFRQRHEATKEAIAAGRVRFVEVLDVEVHICRDPESGKKLRVQRVVLPNGQEIASVSPYPFGSVGTRSYSMSWQDHLAAIDNGTRELLDKQITKLYMYEATLADGSTARYGSNVPPQQQYDEQYDEEMKRAMAERKGELIRVKHLESGITAYIYKVTLSDGTVRTYASDLPPQKEEE